MASIDKIYGTIEQYDEFYNWVGNNRAEYLPYFYERNGWQEEDIRPLTNMPISADRWLLAYCPIEWVKERIRVRYDLNEGDDTITDFGKRD